MTKKIGVMLMGLFVLVFSSVNLFLYFNKGEKSYSVLSGNIIQWQVISGMNISLIAFITQWIILLLIVFFSYNKFLKEKKDEDVKEIGISSVTEIGNLETELDVLYKLLKEKRRLSIGAVAKAFNIKKEKALEWARILEDYEIVTIEYPAFNDPEIEIKEKIVKNE